MRSRNDFSKAIKNPYAKRLKRTLTIRIDTDTIEYFRRLSDELAVPYQTLLNMYLRECATSGRRPSWIEGAKGQRSAAVRSRSGARGKRPSAS